MSLAQLVTSLAGTSEFPIKIDDIRDWFINNGYQDVISFFPVELDRDKLRGQVIQYKDRLWNELVPRQ